MRLRSVLINTTNNSIVFDDLHTVIYARISPTPPLLTISYHGNAIILQDNTLFKEQKSYSISPSDGIEFDIITQVSRYEEMPSYYPMREEAGPICVLFGLIADYYDTVDPRRSRGSVTTDSLFIFICRAHGMSPELIEVTRENASTVSWPPRGYEFDPLASILEKHSSFRPERR